MRTLTAGRFHTLLPIRPLLSPGDSDVGTVYHGLTFPLSTAELLFLIDSRYGVCYDYLTDPGCRHPIQLKTCDISLSTVLPTSCCHIFAIWSFPSFRTLFHLFPDLYSYLILPCSRHTLYFHPCWHPPTICKRGTLRPSEWLFPTYARPPRTWRVHDGRSRKHKSLQLQ